MKLRKYFFSLLVLGFLCSEIYSQGIGIGQWRAHLPYNNCIAVSILDDKAYCATPYSLFYLNKEDNSLHTLNKINGLSDFGISTMKYSEELDILFIAYSNANVDLLHDGEIINMPEIKRANIIGKKVINDIYFLDNLAYISCGFGIVVMDLIKEEIKDTYFIGPNGSQIEVFDFTSTHSSFYAATEEGIFFASADHPNLADFAAWSKLQSSPHPNNEHNLIANYQGKIITNIKFSGQASDTLYLYNENTWDYFNDQFFSTNNNLNISKDYLLVSNLYRVLVYDQGLSLLYNINSLPDRNNPGHFLSVNPYEAVVDNEDFVWIADKRYGLVKVSEWTVAAESIMPVGPSGIDVFTMINAADNIWIAPGGKNDVWGASFNIQGVSLFEDESWHQFYTASTPELAGIHDFITLAADPFDPDHIFAGAFRNDTALVEFRNNEVANLYDDENSSLQLWQAANAIAVTGLDYDSYGNLWIANSGAPKILSVRINDGSENGEWYAYNLGSSYSSIDIGNVLVDSYNQKWILKRKTIENSTFIIVFNDNNTIEDPSDDRVKGLTNSPGSGNIPGNKLFCLAEDQDGEIWIGSDDGVSVVYTPENVFGGGDYDAQRIIIPRNDGSGLGDILLENEFVKCITIDGDNNKWIGTDGAGVFCLSEDGMTEIYHFTEENSPLFSNLVSGIAINDEGEVFIGTSKGIISFRSEATPAKDEFQDVYAYPNPVREGYTGTIGIKGLVKDANVKITDISGNLIYETRSLGGQAVWNGKSLDGRKADTGVYLVFVSNDDGSQTIVTKILFIN